MEILLIRHTAVDVAKSICYGQTNVGLATSFDTEKADILSKIQEKWGNTVTLPSTRDDEAKGIKGVALWSSPLYRCQILADYLGQNLNRNVANDDNLKELNFGDWEGKAWSDIPETALQTWMSDFVHIKTPNGEAYADLHQRSVDFIEKLLENDVKEAIIVTHAGNIRSFISYALDLPLQHSFRLHLNYGAMASLVLKKDKSMNKLNFLL